MDSVALAATIGGSVVALAGLAVSAWSVRQQRESAKELAASQHAHERELARGERLFERRASAYETLVNFQQIVWERIVDTEPILRLAGTPDPPAAPEPDDFRAMYVRLATYGTAEVVAIYEEFGTAVRDFFLELESK